MRTAIVAIVAIVAGILVALMNPKCHFFAEPEKVHITLFKGSKQVYSGWYTAAELEGKSTIDDIKKFIAKHPDNKARMMLGKEPVNIIKTRGRIIFQPVRTAVQTAQTARIGDL